MNKDEKWLDEKLKSLNYPPRDKLFLVMMDSNGKLFIQRKIRKIRRTSYYEKYPNFISNIFSLLASVLFFNNKLINVCDKVNDYSNKIENSLSKEDWKESYEESLKLSNLLEENYVSLSLYINHEQLDNLSKEILSLTQYIKAEDVSNSLSSVHIIKSYTKHIKDIQKVNIGNILNSNLKNIFYCGIYNDFSL